MIKDGRRYTFQPSMWKRKSKTRSWKIKNKINFTGRKMKQEGYRRESKKKKKKKGE